jgi:hypothetical protein
MKLFHLHKARMITAMTASDNKIVTVAQNGLILKFALVPEV